MVDLHGDLSDDLRKVDHPWDDGILGIIAFWERTVVVFIHTESIWAAYREAHFSVEGQYTFRVALSNELTSPERRDPYQRHY